jgi:AcrR family transcriptional regulator
MAAPKVLTRAERRAQTHEELLDAAESSFAAHGFHASSVASIAREAGYTKGAVYANFEGKTALFLAVLDRHIRRIQDAEPTSAPGIADQFRRDWGLLTFEALMFAVREDPDLLAAIAERYRRIDQVNAVQMAADATRSDSAPPDADDPAGSTRADDLAVAWSALGEGLMMRHLADPEHVDHARLERIFDRVFPGPPADA